LIKEHQARGLPALPLLLVEQLLELVRRLLEGLGLEKKKEKKETENKTNVRKAVLGEWRR